jgi:hypothetical protein
VACQSTISRYYFLPQRDEFISSKQTQADILRRFAPPRTGWPYLPDIQKISSITPAIISGFAVKQFTGSRTACNKYMSAITHPSQVIWRGNVDDRWYQKLQQHWGY